MLEPHLILIHLLIKLGVAAALSSALVRSQEFKKLLFSEERDTAHKIYLALWMAIPIALGVWIRFSAKSFLAGDLSLETALILGVVGGRLSGSLGGALMALPAVLHGEWAALPLYAFAGGVAGQLRRIAPEHDDIWSFSPFVDLSLYRMIRRNLPRPRRVRLASRLFSQRLLDCAFCKPKSGALSRALSSAWRAATCGWRARSISP